jgi:hypothetical protein
MEGMFMERIYNGTPHVINICINSEWNSDIRKFVVADGVESEIISSIASSGVLSAKINTIEGTPINEIPVFSKEIAGCDPLPEGYDIYIVSSLYASAARMVGLDMSKIYTIADPIYSADGRTILGSRGICPAF